MLAFPALQSSSGPNYFYVYFRSAFLTNIVVSKLPPISRGVDVFGLLIALRASSPPRPLFNDQLQVAHLGGVFLDTLTGGKICTCCVFNGELVIITCYDTRHCPFFQSTPSQLTLPKNMHWFVYVIAIQACLVSYKQLK